MPLPLRPYTPLRMVLTTCGHCFEEDPEREVDYATDILQGNLVEQDGRVYLRRYCRRGHGEVVSLYEEDYALWSYLQQWRTPTRTIVPDSAANLAPIPMGYAEGLGDLQTQHSCILLLDINEACNLACPACFADAGPFGGNYLSPTHVLRVLDDAIEREGGELDVLMLSGGEPTIHPMLEQLVDEALRRPVHRVMINSNGVRIARDDRFVAFLGERRERVEVYLQFDSFEEAPTVALRGEDLRPVKEAAIERLTAAQVYTSLVMTVAEGLNDHELGRAAELVLGTRYLCGMMYQPVFGSGRSIPIDPMKRVTTTGVLRRLEAQLPGRVRADDFIALPCSHPDCTSITYFLTEPGGKFKSLPALLGHDRIGELLGLVSNTIVFADARAAGAEAILGMMSQSITATRPELARYAETLCRLCSAGPFAALARKAAPSPSELALRLKRFTVKHFMDAWTLNVERLQQCCVHVGSAAEGSPRVPFCARQLFAPLRRLTSVRGVPRSELIALEGPGVKEAKSG
jgi:uncharacterized radical SAM superfamily Fe-S cluster-containing enzyme